jgi:3-dehydroquinate dehydratase-1
LDIDALVRSCRAAHLEPICTCRVRAKAQGGNYIPRDAAEHEMLLKRMISAKPSFVDVELVNDTSILDLALDTCRDASVGVILSIHDFSATPSLPEVDALCELLLKAVLQHPPEHDNIVFKVVFTARKPVDNTMPLRVIKRMTPSGHEVVSFCMGAAGLLSRVACVLPRAAGAAASKFTFAALGQATAPGQIDLPTMVALLDPFF